MKKNFDLSYKDDIIAGKVKVVTDCGEPVEIVKWDCKGGFPILAVIGIGDNDLPYFFDESGHSCGRSATLFVITDEPELTEFESELLSILCDYGVQKASDDDVRKDAERLLNIAHKQHCYELEDAHKKGYDRGYQEGFEAGVNIDEETLTDKIAEKVAEKVVKDGNPFNLPPFWFPSPSNPNPPCPPIPITVMYGVSPVEYKAAPDNVTTKSTSTSYNTKESEE